VALASGTIAALLLLGYSLGNPSTAGILLLWNGGLAGLLPSPFYAAALGLTVATIVALWRGGDASLVPALIVLVTAGATLQNTYQTGLLVGALLLAATLPGWTVAHSIRTHSTRLPAGELRAAAPVPAK
jgi:hypothetical protein